jgi:hypothetical protein
LGAGGRGFGLGKTPTSGPLALGLASLAALGFVLKVLVLEEVLFSRCENEIRPAVYALEYSILKLRHSLCPVNSMNCCWKEGGTNIPPPVAQLLNFPAILLPVPFTGQRLLGPELLTRFQVERMSLDLFNDVFLLDLSLEAPKSVF